MSRMSTLTLPEVVPGLIANGFFADAAVDLGKVLAAEPSNARAWDGLVRVCRASGDLAAARVACAARVRLRPDDEQAAYMLAVLSGDPLPAQPREGERYASPFVRIADFLSDAEHGLLLDVVSRQYARSTASTVRAGEHDPEMRQSKIVPRDETQAVLRWFAPKVRELLPRTLPRLSSRAFDAGRIELQVTVHNDGDFYSIHSDDHEGDEQPRLVSYVYYFHEQPKRFTGGDLLLYDSDLVNRQCLTAFTRIEPIDNSIVLFPSPYFHQVTPIHCETREYRDGRFTVNGWIHAHTAHEAVAGAQ